MIPRLAAFLVLLAAAAVFPLFAGKYPVTLLQEILIWGVFATSLDLLMGYAAWSPSATPPLSRHV